MKTLITLTLSMILLAAAPALAQQYDRTRGELSPGTQAPNRADMVTVINSGTATHLIATLEYGERVECFECIPLLSRKLLESSDARVREISAWWLRRRPFGMGPIMIHMKSVLATDSDPVRRTRAAEALGEFMDGHALPALSTAVTGDADAGVRAAAVRALGRLNVYGGNTAIAAAFGDVDANVRRAALSVVLRVNFFRAYDAIIPLLGDSDADVRRRSALILGSFRVDTAVSPLIAMLRGDTSTTARQAAAWALGRIGGSEAQTALAETYGTESVSLVRDAIEIAQQMRR